MGATTTASMEKDIFYDAHERAGVIDYQTQTEKMMAYKEIEAYKDEKQVHVKHDKYTFYTKDEKSNM